MNQKNNRTRIQEIISIICSLLAGISLALLVYIFHFEILRFRAGGILACVLIALGASALVYYAFRKKLLPAYQALKVPVRILALILLVFFILLFAKVLSYEMPHLYLLYPRHQLTVEMDLGDLSPDAEGITLSRMELAYGEAAFDELELEGSYEVREDAVFFPAGEAASLSWEGVSGETLTLVFAPTAEPCDVKITLDGQASSLQLFQPDQDAVTFRQEFPVIPRESTIIRGLTLPLIAFILALVLAGLFSPNSYPALIAACWLVILLVYWPGMIGRVNIEAVEDLLAGHPTDWHPIIYTILLTLGSQLFSSAVSILIFQLIILAWVFGDALYFLQTRGLPKATAWILGLLFALTPTNFLMIITITNDVPYAIAILGLTYVSLKIVLSGGGWLDDRRNFIILTLISAAAVLFRYNGVPAIALFVLCLALFYRKQAGKALLSLGLAALIFMFVSGPLGAWLNVSKQSEGHLDNIILHHLSAHVAAGTPLSDEESDYLNALLPLDEWDYSCCTNAAMWENPDFDVEMFHANSAYNRELELSLFRRDPGLELDHMLCASDLIWNPFDGICKVKSPAIKLKDSGFSWTSNSMPQYDEASMLPGLVEPVSVLINKLSYSVEYSFILWRPAWYLYISIICTVIFCLRIKSWKGLLLISPALGQTLFLLLANRVQNFRYQYCVVLVGWLLLALAFSKPGKEKEA